MANPMSNSQEPAKTTGNSTIDQFLEHCHLRRYPSKSLIIYAGDTPDVLYYLIDGSVAVLMEDNDGHEIVLAYLNKGDFFGEMGLFDNNPAGRSAWVRARNDCTLAEISYSKFRSITHENPDLLFALAGQMATRLRKTSRKV
ncbi:MAG: cyclic nucleotide-binding domain-containing protein, partial [Gammaproteobacteria bacterium]|nr:cyclic nucleotide-binding domain-containing protein [Gammaproteobacteria bacterium]